MAMEAAGVLADTHPVDVGRSYQLIAAAFEERGERARAIERLELAAELLERVPNRYAVEVYGSLADLYEAEGRKDDALAVLRKGMRVQVAARRSLTDRND